MLPHISDKGIQYQGCHCLAWIQALLYHFGLDDDFERTTPYTVRSVKDCVFERRQKIMEKRRRTYILLRDCESYVFVDRSAHGLQPKSAPAPVLKGDLFEALPQAPHPKGENGIALAGVEQTDLRLQCEDKDVKKLTVTKAEPLLALSSAAFRFEKFLKIQDVGRQAVQSVSNSKTSYISSFHFPHQTGF